MKIGLYYSEAFHYFYLVPCNAILHCVSLGVLLEFFFAKVEAPIILNDEVF